MPRSGAFGESNPSLIVVNPDDVALFGTHGKRERKETVPGAKIEDPATARQHRGYLTVWSQFPPQPDEQSGRERSTGIERSDRGGVC
jgi:hypothetical protein